jgi:translation elongation factor EF-4
MDVFRQRLEDEYDANVIITAPTVPYKGRKFAIESTRCSHRYSVVFSDRVECISNPTEFPDVADTTSKVKEVQEPIVRASIIVPQGNESWLNNVQVPWHDRQLYRVPW